MKRAVIYSRFSTDRQNDATIDVQEAVCEEYAKAHSLKVVAKFKDEGLSGTTLARPGLQALIEAVNRKTCDVVLVRDVKRLARGEDLAPLIKRLKFREVRVIGVVAPFDSDMPHARMQAALDGMIGGAEVEAASLNARAALMVRAREGNATGGASYGYTTVSAGRFRSWVVDQKQAAVVRDIFAWFNAGATCRDIAKRLNDRKVPSPGVRFANRNGRPRARVWILTCVRAILRNRRYIGEFVWNRCRMEKNPDTGIRVRRPLPPSEWKTHVDESLRIVDQRTWDKAEARFAATAKRRSGGRAKYLLSGILTCAHCGGPFKIAHGDSMGCSRQIISGVCDNDVKVRRQEAEKRLLDPIFHKLLGEEFVTHTVKHMRKYFRAQMATRAGRTKQLPADVLELDTRLAKLRAKLAAGDDLMTPDELADVIAKVQAKRENLVRALPSQAADNDLRALPKLAQEYREQIRLGLYGKTEHVVRARVYLRQMLHEGKILCRRKGRTLTAALQVYLPKASGVTRDRYARSTLALAKGGAAAGTLALAVPLVP